MKKYRLFVLTFEGIVIQNIALFCTTEDDAKLPGAPTKCELCTVSPQAST
ncbi:hypothetical protein QA640_15080 [Bradyrhizobium sp. CB82]|nr:hypothetical protein [Bradyrhizobium sp. CB82]WFU43636.1 hypothetical protein QA640_15080 [Bradyrhizobium sp. CB82]